MDTKISNHIVVLHKLHIHVKNFLDFNDIEIRRNSYCVFVPSVGSNEQNEIASTFCTHETLKNAYGSIGHVATLHSYCFNSSGQVLIVL